LPASGEIAIPDKNVLYATGHGFVFQISFACPAMAWSLENFPDAATFIIACVPRHLDWHAAQPASDPRRDKI
jgi:hypothetical protein